MNKKIKHFDNYCYKLAKQSVLTQIQLKKYLKQEKDDLNIIKVLKYLVFQLGCQIKKNRVAQISQNCLTFRAYELIRNTFNAEIIYGQYSFSDIPPIIDKKLQLPFFTNIRKKNDVYRKYTDMMNSLPSLVTWEDISSKLLIKKKIDALVLCKQLAEQNSNYWTNGFRKAANTMLYQCGEIGYFQKLENKFSLISMAPECTVCNTQTIKDLIPNSLKGVDYFCVLERNASGDYVLNYK